MATLLRSAVLFVLFLPIAFAVDASQSSKANQAGQTGGQNMSLTLSSSSFPNGGTIPRKFTCDGEDVSPELSWSNAPAGTKTFALLADDPDAPAGNWNHWAIWNIPGATHKLGEGVPKTAHLPDGSVQGLNDFHKAGYNGPCPPGHNPHHYHFKVFALDTKLSLADDAGKRELESAMKGHVLAQGEWIGQYRRK